MNTQLHGMGIEMDGRPSSQQHSQPPSSDVVIIIPARIGSTRLARKMLLPTQDGVPLIAATANSAQQSGVGTVYVACDSPEIADAVQRWGHQPVLTEPILPSGTDRIWNAYESLSLTHEYVVNLQGDIPYMPASIIRQTVAALRADPAADIATPVAISSDPEGLADRNTVKAVLRQDGRALYFSRQPLRCSNLGEHGAYYKHIGLYVYRASSLKRLVALPPSALELAESLEQLRALEAGMRIAATVIRNERAPLSIDTESDYRRLLAETKSG